MRANHHLHQLFSKCHKMPYPEDIIFMTRTTNVTDTSHAYFKNIYIQIEENSSPYLETNCTYLKGNFHTSPITRVELGHVFIVNDSSFYHIEVSENKRLVPLTFYKNRC